MRETGTPDRETAAETSAASSRSVSGRVSNISGGQVAIGDKVVQIDASTGAHIVINEGDAVHVSRRAPPVLRPAPAPPQLVGRDGEIKAVLAALAQGRSVEVIGPDGMGKTTVLRAVSNLDRPRLTPDGLVAVPARLGVVETLGYLFDSCYEGTHRMVPRREELASALADVRLLVVLDDTSLDRESINELRLALPKSLFVLSAHEQRVFGDVDGVLLRGLSDEESVALIQTHLDRVLDERERAVVRPGRPTAPRGVRHRSTTYRFRMALERPESWRQGQRSWRRHGPGARRSEEAMHDQQVDRAVGA